MIIDAAKILLGYLLGSISGSLVLGRLRGIDIRTQGSGNAGGTNAFRTQGAWFALGVALIDVGKSALAAGIGGMGDSEPEHRLRVALLASAAAVAGHVWPLYFGFRGGKGVAAVLGALLVLWPAGLGLMLATAILALTTTGYVGLGSILGGVALIPSAVWLAPAAHRSTWIVTAVAIAAFVAFTHRSNIRRMRAGTEHRFERARIWARMFSRSQPGR